MLLVYDDILSRVNEYQRYKNVYANGECKPLIENFKAENLQSASYDVSISNTIMKEQDKFEIVHLNNEVDTESVFTKVNIQNGYKLRPDEFIIVKINERLNMPDDLAGHVRPRTTFNRLGLIITCQHINPSYNGNLQLGLKNMTHKVIEIVPNLIIGQIVFETLNNKIREEALYRNKENSKYQGEEDFVTSKVYQEAHVKKANEIFEKIINDMK